MSIESITIGARKIDFRIPIWYMIDMSYYAVSNCKQIGGTKIGSRDEFIELIWQYNSFAQEQEHNNPLFKNRKQTDQMPPIEYYYYLMALTGEQFQFQNIFDSSIVKENIVRNYYILDKIAGSVEDDGIDTEKILYEALNVTPNELITVLFSLFAVFCEYKTISNFDELAGQIHISSDVLNGIIDHYSIDYITFQKSDLKRQQLYVTPIIKLENNRYICPCTAILFNTISNAWLWVIRDYFKEKDSQDFTNKFGEYYEQYFNNEIKNKYLSDCICEKVKTGSTRKADWHIVTETCSFIIEQKSAIASIHTKQQDGDLDKIKDFVRRNIEKALIQLSNVQKENAFEKPIKIVLMYDDYFRFNRPFEIIVDSMKDKIVDDGYYWIASTRDIELLFYLYHNNRDKYNVIVKEMLRISSTDKGGRPNLAKLLCDNKVYINEHLESPEYTGYFDEMNKRFDEIMASE